MGDTAFNQRFKRNGSWKNSTEFINYCKTWMIVDIVTLAPDWAFTLVRMMNPNLAGWDGVRKGGKMVQEEWLMVVNSG